MRNKVYSLNVWGSNSVPRSPELTRGLKSPPERPAKTTHLGPSRLALSASLQPPSSAQVRWGRKKGQPRALQDATSSCHNATAPCGGKTREGAEGQPGRRKSAPGSQQRDCRENTSAKQAGLRGNKGLHHEDAWAGLPVRSLPLLGSGRQASPGCLCLRTSSFKRAVF